MTKNRAKWEKQRAERIREEELYKSMVLDTTKWRDSYHPTWEEYRKWRDEFKRREEEEDRLRKEYRKQEDEYWAARANGAPPRGSRLSWEDYKRLKST